MRILSGIQPTGDKHLGNYVGAIQRWVTQQDEADCFYPIVDLHAITVPQDPDELRESTLNLAALLIACGIDPDRSTLFVQSHVPEHPRLTWVLECMTPYGDLRRMPQYREKSAREQGFGVGLLTYPVLQAADILLYQADAVPVGEDQRQHLELARDIAQRFNNRFGETFTVPEGTYPEIGAKIMDVQDPTSRMSTSAATDAGVLRLLEPPDSLRRKIRSAVTDSGKEVVRSPEKPGVTNLIEILAAATGEAPEAIEARYDAQGYGASRPTSRRPSSSSSRPYRRAMPSCARIRASCGRSWRRAPARRARSPRRRSRSPTSGWASSLPDASPSAARPHGAGAPLPRGKLAPLTRSKPAEVEAGVAGTVQATHRVPDGFEHPLDLVGAPLVEDELHDRVLPPSCEHAGARRRSAAVLQLDALPQLLEVGGVRHAEHVRLVHLLHAVARMGEPVRQGTVVRE